MAAMPIAKWYGFLLSNSCLLRRLSTSRFAYFYFQTSTHYIDIYTEENLVDGLVFLEFKVLVATSK